MVRAGAAAPLRSSTLQWVKRDDLVRYEGDAPLLNIGLCTIEDFDGQLTF
jgi:hypothetical protein